MLLLQHLILTYGYWVLFLGAFIEGETVLVIAGFAAHQGYLSLPLVIFIAFLGSLLNDQLFFFLGRIKGKSVLEKSPKWHELIKKVHHYMEKYDVLFIFGFRFIYGIRIIVPLILGTSRIKTKKFIFLNTIGAAFWAASVGTLGYLFGATLTFLIGRIRHIELQIFFILLVLGLILWLVRLYIVEKN